MVNKIKGERVGISLELLEKTPNPFAIVEKVIKKKEEPIKIEKPIVVIPTEVYELSAILNHAGFINKKWYRVGDKIGSYKVIHIGKTSVTLKRGDEFKRLAIPKREKKFKLFKGK
jgi:hypothetical protein